MKIHTAPSIEYLLCTFPNQLKCGHWYFRGVKDSSYDLTPSLGRQSKFNCSTSLDTKQRMERSMIADFKARSRPLIDYYMPGTEWEWLALAQHHKLPTRLLDWSNNLLSALYFASEKTIKYDGTFEDYTSDECAIYLLHTEDLIPVEDVCYDPIICDKIGIVATAHVSKRMSGQSGVFSIQTDPCISFDKLFEDDENRKYIIKFIIPHELRENLFTTIHRLGVRAVSIYPDLDGLSSEIRQMQELGCSQIQNVSPD